MITSKPKHYTPFQPTKGGEWSFTTPTGRLDHFPARADALRIAANTERDDRFVAETKTGKVACTLRSHFGITRKKKA